jgi:hypothetical protein
MGKAIGIKIKPAGDVYDVKSSKFFGAPTVPREWLDDRFSQDEMFFCQIRLSDIAALDSENRLPHEGYLYVFLRTAKGKDNLELVLREYSGDSTIVINWFNEPVDGYAYLRSDYLMEFFEVEENYAGTKLFGTPASWGLDETPPKVFFQFNPKDTDAGFLEDLNGYLYLLFGEDESDLSQVELYLEG